MSQPQPPAEAKPPLPREGKPAGASPAEAAAAAAKSQQEVPPLAMSDHIVPRSIPHHISWLKRALFTVPSVRHLLDLIVHIRHLTNQSRVVVQEKVETPEPSTQQLQPPREGWEDDSRDDTAASQAGVTSQ